MISDIRIACRCLAKNPAFSLVAIGALALGIGANSAIFSVINAALFHPGGIVEPERVVAVRVSYKKLNLTSIGVSATNFADVRNVRDVFEKAAILKEADLNYMAGDTPVRLAGAQVSLEWFDVFGARPHLGRVFLPEEDQPNANQVAVLAFPAWQRLFGGDPHIVGKTIELNQKPYRVVGVMEPAFRWPAQADIWVPLGLSAADMGEQNRFNESYFGVARLRPGLTLDHANAAVQVLADRVRNNGTPGGTYAKNSLWGLFCVPITDFIAGNAKMPMLILLGASAMVLLIVCANIAGLMLVRASVRARDYSIRTALGAGWRDLLRSIFAEGAVLAACGVSLGLLLAFGGIRVMTLLAPEQITLALKVRIDIYVLLFTLLAGIASLILFSAGPAWQVWRQSLHDSLKEGGRGGTDTSSRQRLRTTLVAGQVAVALILLVSTGILLRTLANLQRVNVGFQPEGVMTGMLALPPERYQAPASRVAFLRELAARLAALPGVTSAGVGAPYPFSGGGASGSFNIEGRPQTPGDPGPHGHIRYVSPGYFTTLKIPLRAGRYFTHDDRQETQPVVIIDEILAKQYWPNEDPIGKRMRRGSRPWATIVGVVGAVRHSDLIGEATKGTYYYPIYQQPVPFAGVLVRTQGAPALLAGPIRHVVRSIDPRQPVDRLKTMPDLISASLTARRFTVTMLGFFAVSALLLATLGLYGVISYSVTQRTREIGIRMALGAEKGTVIQMIIGQGLRLAAAGLLMGVAGALVAARLLRTQLVGVDSFDPVTFGATVPGVILAVLLATYLPARRAARVDPVVALRHE